MYMKNICKKITPADVLASAGWDLVTQAPVFNAHELTGGTLLTTRGKSEPLGIELNHTSKLRNAMQVIVPNAKTLRSSFSVHSTLSW